MKKIKIPYIYDKTKFHTLVHEGGEAWSFHPAEDWMPLRIAYDEVDRDMIYFIDTDGLGSPISVGNKIEDKVVAAIIESDDKYLLFLK